MVSTHRTTNKMVPTIHSTCRIHIDRVAKTGAVDSEYLSNEGEIHVALEDADWSVDRAFVRFLLNTKLNETATFQTDGVTVDFSIVDIEYRPAIHEIADEEKVARAKVMKERGAALCKQNRHEDAFYRFRTGVQYCICLKDKTRADAEETYMMLCNNMALCQMKFKNYEHAVALCSKALLVDGRNEKALYRRAVSYAELKKWEEAKLDLMQAMAVGEDSSVKKLLDTVCAQLKKQDEEYKTVVRNMFK